MRRTALVVVALVVLTGATAAGAVVGATPASASATAPCQAGGNHVALVIDFGDDVSQQCIAFGNGDSGLDVIASRVRLNGAGLVCAIDGFPATGCGEQTDDGHFAYWAYFHGTVGAGWQYANTGPASGRVAPTTVQGWRWEPAGTAKPSDPPPRASADPAATCPPDSTTSSSQPTATSATTTVTDATSPSPSSSTASSSATTMPARSTSSSASSSSSSSASRSSSSSSSSGAVVGPTVHDGGGGGAGSPVGVVAGVGLLGAIGAGALVLARRRGTGVT